MSSSPQYSQSPIQGLIHEESGPAEAPPLVYLPGVHGDPSRMGETSALLRHDMRLIKVTYPRVEKWDLNDYARALEDLLDVLELDSVHLLAESFGSLVGLEFGLSRPSRVRSMTLAAGFTQAPRPAALAVARRALNLLPGVVFETGLDLLDSLLGPSRAFRSRLDREVMPFYAVRSDRLRRATAGRIDIIERSNFVPLLGRVAFPLSYLGGGADRIVPVRREAATLARHLTAPCNFRAEIMPGAPHNILAARPEACTRHILRRVELAEARSAFGDAANLSGRSRS